MFCLFRLKNRNIFRLTLWVGLRQWIKSMNVESLGIRGIWCELYRYYCDIEDLIDVKECRGKSKNHSLRFTDYSESSNTVFGDKYCVWFSKLTFYFSFLDCLIPVFDWTDFESFRNSRYLHANVKIPRKTGFQIFAYSWKFSLRASCTKM